MQILSKDETVNGCNSLHGVGFMNLTSLHQEPVNDAPKMAEVKKRTRAKAPSYLKSSTPKPTTKIYEKTCRCGEKFRVKPCEFEDPNRKYCSRTCSRKYTENPVKAIIHKVKCTHCKKEFEMSHSQFNQKYTKRYCSNECVYEGKKNGILKKCFQCDGEFQRSLSRSEGSKFCKRSCWAEWLVDHPRKGFVGSADNAGTKNGQFKHGKYAGRNRAGGSTSKLKVRKRVIEHDGNWCFLCDKPGPGLHLHRVVYGSQGGKYEVDNCIQLCAEDHAKVHTSKKTWLPVLLSHIKSRSDLSNSV